MNVAQSVVSVADRIDDASQVRGLQPHRIDVRHDHADVDPSRRCHCSGVLGDEEVGIIPAQDDEGSVDPVDTESERDEEVDRLPEIVGNYNLGDELRGVLDTSAPYRLMSATRQLPAIFFMAMSPLILPPSYFAPSI